MITHWVMSQSYHWWLRWSNNCKHAVNIITHWFTERSYDGWMRDREVNVDIWLLTELWVKLIMDDCEMSHDIICIQKCELKSHF